MMKRNSVGSGSTQRNMPSGQAGWPGGGDAGRKDGGRGAGNGSDTVGCTSELDMDERWTQNA